MIRGIYVGKPRSIQEHHLAYGTTGCWKDVTKCFYPDRDVNSDAPLIGRYVPVEDVYFPSTQPTRYCPKPS